MGPHGWMEEIVNEAIRRVSCAAKDIAVVRGGLGSRPAASPVISGVRLVSAGGVAG
jgi:hypothetical protein